MLLFSRTNIQSRRSKEWPDGEKLKILNTRPAPSYSSESASAPLSPDAPLPLPKKNRTEGDGWRPREEGGATGALPLALHGRRVLPPSRSPCRGRRVLHPSRSLSLSRSPMAAAAEVRPPWLGSSSPMVRPFAAHAVARLLSASAIQRLSTSRPPHLAMSWLARSRAGALAFSVACAGRYCSHGRRQRVYPNGCT